MKVELKYIMSISGGFRQEFDTPQAAISAMEKTYHTLGEVAVQPNDFCNYFIDATNKYFPKGSIAYSIDGCYQVYELKTKVKEIL